jgi:hypothetical protein
VVVAAAAACALSLGPTVRGATPTPVTIDSTSPALEDAGGGSWTASLGFTNLTDGEIDLAAALETQDAGCRPRLTPSRLERAAHADVTVTFPPGCSVADDGIDFTVSSTNPGTPVSFDVTAAPKPDTSKPDWDQLSVFPILLAILVVFAAACLAVCRLFKNGPRLRTELKYLDSTWSFQDSWVSNVTVIGGLLTGIFGSVDVVTALLGEDADRSVALATVGAAVAAAFVAASPIILLTTMKNDFVTVGGLFLAAVFTLTGAAGELWVVSRAGAALDLGGWQDRIVYLAVFGFALLGAYAIRSVVTTIAHGATTPQTPPSDTLVAAQWIADAIKGREPARGLASTPPRRQRSAML